DNDTKIIELRERTHQALRRITVPMETMKLIDTFQRLGIGYNFEDEINALLKGFSDGHPDEDLLAIALHFRLLRHYGYQISTGTNSTPCLILG
ncbi:unnamed protein product, partial [Ilex paraguariensis]